MAEGKTETMVVTPEVVREFSWVCTKPHGKEVAERVKNPELRWTVWTPVGGDIIFSSTPLVLRGGKPFRPDRAHRRSHARIADRGADLTRAQLDAMASIRASFRSRTSTATCHRRCAEGWPFAGAAMVNSRVVSLRRAGGRFGEAWP